MEGETMKEKIVNRTKNRREFSAHLENKILKRLRKEKRRWEREFKALRLSLGEVAHVR
jgi:hypothetical protein